MIGRTTATVVMTLTLALAGAGGARAEGDVEAGRMKAETCLGCHAVEGYFNVYPTYRVPKLGGQSGKYIETALKAYRDGQRTHSTMHANAADLSDQDMADIGAYMESFRQ